MPSLLQQKSHKVRNDIQRYVSVKFLLKVANFQIRTQAAVSLCEPRRMSQLRYFALSCLYEGKTGIQKSRLKEVKSVK